MLFMCLAYLHEILCRADFVNLHSNTSNLLSSKFLNEYFNKIPSVAISILVDKNFLRNETAFKCTKSTISGPNILVIFSFSFPLYVSSLFAHDIISIFQFLQAGPMVHNSWSHWINLSSRKCGNSRTYAMHILNEYQLETVFLFVLFRFLFSRSPALFFSIAFLVAFYFFIFNIISIQRLVSFSIVMRNMVLSIEIHVTETGQPILK